MRHLSNSVPDADAPAGVPGETARCRPAHKDQIKTALRLILATSGRWADDAQVLDFLRFAMQRGIDLNNLWIAEDQRQLAWAILPVPSPGRTMLLFSPAQAPDQTRRQAARELVDEICSHFTGRGIQLAQVLLDPQDTQAGDLYRSCAFETLAELVYLQASVRRPPPLPALPNGFELRTYTAARHGLFAEAIRNSYTDSLDCPALNGLRDIEDVIAGHKATGEFDPRLWLLLSEDSQPRGVLLLSPMRHADAMELVYLGLVPEARGRQLADLLMRHALDATAGAKLSRLSLAVDSRNVQALKLYFRHGLRRLCSKIAMLRELRTNIVSPKPETSRAKGRSAGAEMTNQ